MKKMNKKARICICAGLILNSAAFITGESYHLPDFFNGLLHGGALGLMIIGLFFQRTAGGRSDCRRRTSQSNG
jgi:hypothetical protein